MDTYCWIHSTYSIPSRWNGTKGTDYSHPGVAPHADLQDGSDVKYHKYYQVTLEQRISILLSNGISQMGIQTPNAQNLKTKQIAVQYSQYRTITSCYESIMFGRVTYARRRCKAN